MGPAADLHERGHRPGRQVPEGLLCRARQLCLLRRAAGALSAVLRDSARRRGDHRDLEVGAGAAGGRGWDVRRRSLRRRDRAYQRSGARTDGSERARAAGRFRPREGAARVRHARRVRRRPGGRGGRRPERPAVPAAHDRVRVLPLRQVSREARAVHRARDASAARRERCFGAPVEDLRSRREYTRRDIGGPDRALPGGSARPKWVKRAADR